MLQSGGPRYEVETGRRDGRVSSISDASIMPDVDDPIDVLKSKFASKGLSATDLVLLSGGKVKKKCFTLIYFAGSEWQLRVNDAETAIQCSSSSSLIILRVFKRLKCQEVLFLLVFNPNYSLNVKLPQKKSDLPTTKFWIFSSEYMNFSEPNAFLNLTTDLQKRTSIIR